MNIFVTGGAGFIGSNFIRHILGKYADYKVVNFDKLTYAGNLQNLADLSGDPRYKFVKGDICDASAVISAVKGADAIVHFAAESHVDRSIVNGDDFLRTNIIGTRVLLEAALQGAVKRFIHISTDEVYGSIEKGSFTEDSLLDPSSPYSASKAAADLLVGSYVVTYGLPASIVRSTNNFGPYQYPEKMIPLFITNLLEGKKVPLYGDGMNVRDWLYVEDNCRAVDLVLHKGESGGIYNIGAGNEIANIALSKKLLKALSRDSSFIERVDDRPGHDRRYSVERSKITKLGWVPESRFEDALEETIIWYKEHVDWWRPLKEKLGEDSYHWLKRDAGKGARPGVTR